MKIMTKVILLFAFMILQSCASHSQVMPMSSYQTYSPSITTNSYMYRSPPPAAMGGGMMHGGAR